MNFKICVVGCGNMAVGFHGPSYQRYAKLHTDVELAACCDLDESKAVFFKENFGFFRSYTDIDLMLDSEKPDAVCLVVPVHLTCSLSLKIMGKGYPLLLEKPPGLDKNETIEMIRTANQGDTPNQVAFNRRYIPLVRKLKDLLDALPKSNEYVNIQFRMLRVGRKDTDFATTAIHGIDVVKYVVGSEYKTVNFRYKELNQVGKNVANIHMDCEFESGASARLDFLPVSGLNAERLEVNVHNHTFFLHLPVGGSSMDFPGTLTHFENNEVKLELNGTDVAGSDELFVLSGFYHENELFFEDIRNGRKPAGDIASGLQSVEIAECIRKRAANYTRDQES